MKNQITIHVRNFPVIINDKESGKPRVIQVPVTKQQLQAAQTVGQSSKELIKRMCERQGYEKFGKSASRTSCLLQSTWRIW